MEDEMENIPIKEKKNNFKSEGIRNIKRPYRREYDGKLKSQDFAPPKYNTHFQYTLDDILVQIMFEFTRK